MVIKRFLPALVLSAWFGTMAWLVRDDGFQVFLKPDFKWLVIAGMVISLVLVAGLLSSGISQIPVQKQAWIKGLILLLPIGFIFSAGESTLGEYALSKRVMVAPQKKSSGPATEISPGTADTISDPSMVSISSLIREFEKYDGKAVQVEGMFAQAIYGHDELSAVFRYFITCCAADAQPVGVFIPRPKNAALENNDWVRVSGKVDMRQMDGYDIIYMAVDTINAAKKPGKNAAYIFE